MSRPRASFVALAILFALVRGAPVSATVSAWSLPVELFPTTPAEKPYYFYRPLDYGSASLIHPLRMITNGGYGILQLDNRDSRVTRIDYQHGWNIVWKNLSDPVTSIEQAGWWDFFQREVIPVSLSNKGAHYWPNYMNHLIGGGMSYRLMAEWFRYHGYPHPRSMSIVTMTAYHLLNEVVENTVFTGYTTDPIADLYIFDPLSILLFSSDRVSRFFGETLHMADWSYQPAIDPRDGRLENVGQNFTVKWDLPWSQRWQLFYHWGTHGEGGLTYKRSNGESLSVGLGLRAKELIDLSDDLKTVDLAVSGAIFYDRNNSLLASLLLTRTKDRWLRFNVYPGWFRMGPISPGIFFIDTRNEGSVFGFTLNVLSQIPVGLSRGFD